MTEKVSATPLKCSKTAEIFRTNEALNLMATDNLNTAALRELLAKLPEGPFVKDFEFNDNGGMYDTIRNERFDSVLSEHGASDEALALIVGLLNNAATLLDNTDRLAALEAGMLAIREGSRYQSSDGAWTYIVPQAVIDALLNPPADGGE